MNRRLQKEIEMLSRDPGPGITVWQTADNVNELNAQIIGPEESPYASGVFSLVLNIPEK
jgi:ubiquitin-conjugating enzyme E2 T